MTAIERLPNLISCFLCKGVIMGGFKGYLKTLNATLLWQVRKIEGDIRFLSEGGSPPSYGDTVAAETLLNCTYASMEGLAKGVRD
jgi:hypothetical protein